MVSLASPSAPITTVQPRLIDGHLDTIRKACLVVKSQQYQGYMLDVDDMVAEVYVLLAPLECTYQPHRGSLQQWVYAMSRTLLMRHVVVKLLGMKVLTVTQQDGSRRRQWVRSETPRSQMGRGDHDMDDTEDTHSYVNQ